MKANEILEQIYRVREEHARECGYDIDTMFARMKDELKRLEKQGWKVVSPGPREAMDTSALHESHEAIQASQRAKMRELYILFNGNREKCVSAYAEAERLGQVVRTSNEHGMSAEEYASRLFADGIFKKWLVVSNS